jgi:hypothetical protein
MGSLLHKIIHEKIETNKKKFATKKLKTRWNDPSVFLGLRQQWDAFVPTPYSRIPEIPSTVNPQKIYRYLRVLKALHPAYKNIVIDESKKMFSKP